MRYILCHYKLSKHSESLLANIFISIGGVHERVLDTKHTQYRYMCFWCDLLNKNNVVGKVLQ